MIDFSYILYRSYYSLKNFAVELEGGLKRPTGHIVGVLSTIMNLIDYDENAYIFLCLDGYPLYRKELCESIGVGYKADRTKPDYNIKADTDLICNLLMHIPNVYVVENDEAESDDLMFALSRHLDKSNKCFIYTGDRDLLQAINENTSIITGWKNSKPIIITQDSYTSDETLYKKFRACQPDKLPFYRAFVGDSSDNLKGVYRMNKDFACQLATIMQSIDDIDNAKTNFGYLATTPNKLKLLSQIQDEYHNIIKVNYEIMKLHDNWDYTITRDLVSIKEIIEAFKLNKFKYWLSKYHIKII